VKDGIIVGLDVPNHDSHVCHVLAEERQRHSSSLLEVFVLEKRKLPQP
jgi:hypothetical protein